MHSFLFTLLPLSRIGCLSRLRLSDLLQPVVHKRSSTIRLRSTTIIIPSSLSLFVLLEASRSLSILPHLVIHVLRCIFASTFVLWTFFRPRVLVPRSSLLSRASCSCSIRELVFSVNPSQNVRSSHLSISSHVCTDHQPTICLL